ncbi:MAG TPA: hypothetical protein ENK96_06455 [Desulfobulbaceae bacterium]|nr:hypothetical protein [Desulfobulbaceae bacterium]
MWVWISTAIISLILLVLSVVTFPKITLQTFNAQRLKRFISYPGKMVSPSVAVLGTSLTEKAFYKDEAMERISESQGDGPMHFLRFTLDGGVLPDFHALLSAVIEARPDLICIESALFTVNFRGQSFRHYVFDRHRSYIRKCIKKILIHVPLVRKRYYLPTEFGRGNYKDPPFGKPKRLQQDRTAYRKNVRRMKIRSFADGKRYADLFNRAHHLGVRICLLDLPRSDDAWQLLSAGFKMSCRQLIAQYEHTYGVMYQAFSLHLTQEDFTDMAHLSARGRHRYSKWFIEQLPQLLKK